MFYPNYKEATIKCKIVKRGEGDDLRFVPDLPDLKYGLVLVYCDGRNHYAYPLPASTEGKDCICHVVYHTKDDEVMSKFAGIIGQGNDVCLTAEYKSIVKTTVADVEIAKEKAILIAEAEKLGTIADVSKVDYKEADALDGAPMWVFNSKGYLDYVEEVAKIKD